jgi:DNA-directed RNA polymerase II subunit RPB11
MLPYVIFAGYKVPHPLEARVVLKVQTDGAMSPIQAVQEACQQLIVTLAKMKTQFASELLKARAMGEGGDEHAFYGGGMEGIEGQAGYL